MSGHPVDLPDVVVREDAERLLGYISACLQTAVGRVLPHGNATATRGQLLAAVASALATVAPAAPSEGGHRHTAMSLGPVLDGFVTLKDDERVRELDTKMLRDAEDQIRQNAPTTALVGEGVAGVAGAAELREHIARLRAAYRDVIQERATAPGRTRDWLRIIRAGNDSFRNVYASVWKETIAANEAVGIKAYTASVAALRQVFPLQAPQQSTADIVSLYVEAAKCKPCFEVTMGDMASKFEQHTGTSLDLVTCPTLKQTPRIVEKAMLRADSTAGVKDIVRAMAVVTSMQDVAAVLAVLLEMHHERAIAVLRIKERFIESPSGGGWRDVMVNITCGDFGHICELQVAHSNLLNARKGLPGHLVYGKVRNALELMMYTRGSVDMAGLGDFVPNLADPVPRHLSGWLEDDVPLGEWAGVTTNSAGDVTGLQLALICHDVTDHSLPDISKTLPKLEHLDCTGRKLSEIAKHCGNLRSLVLDDCKQLSYKGCIDIAKNGQNLVNLQMSATMVSDSILSEIAKHCTRLRNLGLRKHASAGAFGVIWGIGVVHLAECVGARLQHLNLHGQTKVTGIEVSALAAHCINLQTLDLGGTSASEISLLQIAESCTGLEALDISGTCEVGPDTCKALAKYCRKLQNLNLACFEGWYPDAAAENAAKQTRSSWNDGLVQMAGSCTRTLVQLSVGDRHVDDASVLSVSRSLPGLIYFDLGGCHGLTDGSIVEVARSCVNLEHIDLGLLREITDSSIVAIAGSCPSVRHLDVRSCSKLTDAALLSLAQNCKELTHLHATGIEQLTDAGGIEVAKNCTKLQLFRMSITTTTKNDDDSIASTSVSDKDMLKYFQRCLGADGSASLAPNCPGSHGLVSFITERPGVPCELCQRSMARVGMAMHKCEGGCVDVFETGPYCVCDGCYKKHEAGGIIYGAGGDTPMSNSAMLAHKAMQ
jgi:hypothetical protein